MGEISAPQFAASVRLNPVPQLAECPGKVPPLHYSPRKPGQEGSLGGEEWAGSQRAFLLQTHLVTSLPTLWASPLLPPNFDSVSHYQ